MITGTNSNQEENIFTLFPKWNIRKKHNAVYYYCVSNDCNLNDWLQSSFCTFSLAPLWKEKHSAWQNRILAPSTNRLNMQVTQSISSTGGGRGRMKTPLYAAKSIRETQFGFEKILLAPCSSATLAECVCSARTCVGVFVPTWCFVCVGLQQWVRQSKLFIQVQWPAAHYRDEWSERTGVSTLNKSLRPEH